MIFLFNIFIRQRGKEYQISGRVQIHCPMNLALRRVKRSSMCVSCKISRRPIFQRFKVISNTHDYPYVWTHNPLIIFEILYVIIESTNIQISNHLTQWRYKWRKTCLTRTSMIHFHSYSHKYIQKNHARIAEHSFLNHFYDVMQKYK